jgi:CTP:phosphocholine cytidylyltransferase-like protein
MVFTYGLISPTILFLGFLYFGFKYFIDKYNLTVVYPKEYDGRGNISNNISYYFYLSIFLVQILMLGLFTTTLHRESFYWGILIFMVF